MTYADLSNLIACYWSLAWPVVTAAVTVASALNTLPQPKPGSHWLPLRKVISFVALEVGGASNGAQPKFETWVLRILSPYLKGQGLKLVAEEVAPVVNNQTSATPLSPEPPL